jgi:cytochrome c peroxidase
LNFPEHFPKPIYKSQKDNISKQKIELGRLLFYDPILSLDSSISCASCHSPYNAFAHTDHDLSHGIKDQIGNRNAPALFNLAWHPLFMWDGAVNHLDVQALAPISHQKEMNESIKNIISKINRQKFYKEFFYKAFKDSIATGEKLLKALSQFQISLISANSKYDRVKLGKDEFTQQEKNGYAIFLKHCSSCHTEPLFSNFQFESNGLKLDTTLNDFGRWNVTKLSKDSMRFKVPSLRNLSYTYPYMHDGRFKKLGQVINHYVNGIKGNEILSQQLKNGIPLSSNEKTDLIAFLLTLDDKEFVFNPKHQFPKIILNKDEGIK